MDGKTKAWSHKAHAQFVVNRACAFDHSALEARLRDPQNNDTSGMKERVKGREREEKNNVSPTGLPQV